MKMCYSSINMPLFGRKPSPETPKPLIQDEVIQHEYLVVEPSTEWIGDVDLESRIKFVRRGHIVLVAVATRTIDHYAISHGRPDLEPHYALEVDDSVQDAGYLVIDRSEQRQWDVKVDGFSGTYARGNRPARVETVEVLKERYLPNLIVTTDDELGES
jgi:hypothetical protein